MEKLSNTAKVFLFLSCLSGILWMGSYLTRLFLIYQLFEPKYMNLKEYINDSNLKGIFITILPAVTTHFALYIVMVLSFLIFIFISKIRFRKEGWYFISVVIFIVTLPFESYLMLFDYKIIMMVNSGVFNSDNVLELIIKRLNFFGSFPLIELLCYAAIAFLLIFKPLRIKKIEQ